LRWIELVVLTAAVGVAESTIARLRLRRVPLFLAGATVLSGLAVVLTLVRGHA
jgi:formate hydrogenlyase subunit 4